MSAPPADRVAAVRAFNRFYTTRIGVLREGLHDTPHSLAEARVLFELGRNGPAEVADLRRTLAIDAGHLSRLLARLDAAGLVVREPSENDARRRRVRLTTQGDQAYATLDQRSAAEIQALLDGLPEPDQRRLVAAMDVVNRLLDNRTDQRPPAAYVLREPEPGDLGWIVQRHGALYAHEYGWDQTFEALVARIVADFAQHRDPKRERAWIAEVGGAPAGSVLCARRDERTAQLRLLLVEPAARGLGIGARLVEECVRFARRAGYEEIALWTNDVLHAARRIYQRAGFTLVEEEPHHSFGHDLVGQTWARPLR
jgi:DNA-binding MarR family transcriptional regulator/N-acetylglutamate synthase-like GNAT family acetyltransferase